MKTIEELKVEFPDWENYIDEEVKDWESRDIKDSEEVFVSEVSDDIRIQEAEQLSRSKKY